MEPQVIFKASFKSELRRLPFKHSELTYDALYSKLAELFNLSHFKIRYSGEDSDALVVTNDANLKEAISHLGFNSNQQKLVRLFLEELTPTSLEQEAAEDIRLPRTSVEVTATKESTGDRSFEKAVNNGLRNLKEVVQTIFAIERDLSQSLSSLALNSPQQQTPQPPQQTQGESSAGSDIIAPNSPVKTKKQQIPKIPSTTTTTATSEPVVHYGVMCDSCYSVIQGMRWKCQTCSNYDLCQACKSKSPSVHRHPANHEFRQIPFPSSSSSQSFPTSNLHSAICDYCESVIFGIRHKCINCPDFDLCSNCISLATVQHPNHTFMPVHRPGEPEIKIPDAAFHPGIRCDGCSKAINGVRYKCGNCPDFDLCGNCEASPLNKHDDNHAFIKIKRPVTQPLSSREPLLPDFYNPRSETKHVSRNNNNGEEVSTSLKQESQSVPDDCTSETKSFQVLNDSVIKESIEKTRSDTQHAPDEKSSALPLVVCPKLPSPSVSTSTSSIPDLLNYSCNPNDPLKVEKSESKPAVPVLRASFIEDVNVPDGTVLPSQAQFLKIWKMTNDGELIWPETTVLQFVGGQVMFNETLLTPGQENNAPKFPVGAVEPSKSICIAADLQAPAEPGRYVSYWRLTDGEGRRFGHRVWCDIIVEIADQSSSMSSSSMIFPVLTLGRRSASADQRSISMESTVPSIPASHQTSIRTSDIERLVDPEEDPFKDPASSQHETLKNEPEEATRQELELVSNMNDVDSNCETDSFISDSSSSQDFIVVENDFDHDGQDLFSGKLLLSNVEANELLTQSQINSLKTSGF
ncbi:hypothetical protein G9A89_021511 [Geosiphon pyriformis]|nr:hypothetical protein G9A89_021511 [Geosiphon pyriformis]